MKLKAGDKIRVHGWVMLHGLNSGDYRVLTVGHFYQDTTYSFVKLHGTHVKSVHFTSAVDVWIRPAESLDENRIEVL
jgi:hypothetical protein